MYTMTLGIGMLADLAIWRSLWHMNLLRSPPIAASMAVAHLCAGIGFRVKGLQGERDLVGKLPSAHPQRCGESCVMRDMFKCRCETVR